MVVAVRRRCQLTEARLRRPVSLEKSSGTTVMSCVMMLEILFGGFLLYDAVPHFAFVLLLPVPPLLPDKARERTETGLEGTLMLGAYLEPYLGIARARVYKRRMLCRLLPLPLLTMSREAMSRLAGSPVPSASPKLATVGPVALSRRPPSSAGLATCVEARLAVAAEAVEARYVWRAPKAAAHARVALARVTLVAAVMIVSMISITRLIPRACPRSPVPSEATAMALARPIVRRLGARRTAACVFP